jgi:hypothetical protein
MSQVFEFSVFITLALIIFSLAYSAGHFFFVSKKMAISFLEAQAQVEVLLNKIQEIKQHKEETGVEQSKAFIGFISESRDKAFEYIENVQESMYKLKVAREAFDQENIGNDEINIVRNAIDDILRHLPED